ncbi:flagellar biosynthesis protein FlhB [Marinobacterium sedimentorum]|uniref:flagellar biosynthesis protein FlhB n=1 Tax=Marinobacterium sedimentorum TaxID=2927804 RepID=UPI0020C64940|nr:flagellar biosynthesis protein FlhB [Marinobacterium sedimentorum]MCP8689408.1 flagellar type III secretion system protein FlhB [Marinobacterium sedimentorum]
MAEETGQEKTEEPTPKRIREAREKGDVPRSKELGATVLLLAAAASALMFGDLVAGRMRGMMASNLSLEREALFDSSMMLAYLARSMFDALLSLSGFFGLVLLAAIVGPIALGGWNFSGESIQPKASRINPLSGLKRMFSLKALVELVKALAKFLLVASIAILVLKVMQPRLLGLGAQDVVPAISDAVNIVIWTFLLISASLILISLLDVPFQLYDYSKKMKMTLQEVKDEMKSTEGKPEVKGRIRQLQREISQRQMMGKIPEADVVITNPTHYAVALKYDPESGRAPVVLAKGADFVALRIRELAVEHEVPMLSAPPLARALYQHAELDQEIPAGLFKAVAQVLAYVYQLRSYRRRESVAPTQVQDDDLDIPDDLRFDD